MALLSNSVLTPVTIRLEQRKSFTFSASIKVEPDTPADITGCSFRLVVQRSKHPYDTVIESAPAVIDVATGYIRFDLQASELDLDPGAYPYVVVLISPDKYSRVIIKGNVEVLANPEMDSVYDIYDVGVPLEGIDVYLRGDHAVTVRTGLVLPPGYGLLSDQDKEEVHRLLRDGGPQGVKGDKGDKGDRGDPGLQGTQGFIGLQGVKGDTGPRGPQGLQGVKGDKGDKGDPAEAISDYNWTGNGSPYGVLTPHSKGIEYIDLDQTNGACVWISTGTTDTAWKVIAGDTGWRDIRSIANSATGAGLTTCQVRRINETAHFYAYGNTTAGGVGVYNFADLPVGFRSSTEAANVIAADGTPVGVVYVYNANNVRGKITTAGNWQKAALTYISSEVWPTTLPGTAV